MKYLKRIFEKSKNTSDIESYIKEIMNDIIDDIPNLTFNLNSAYSLREDIKEGTNLNSVSTLDDYLMGDYIYGVGTILEIFDIGLFENVNRFKDYIYYKNDILVFNKLLTLIELVNDEYDCKTNYSLYVRENKHILEIYFEHSKNITNYYFVAVNLISSYIALMDNIINYPKLEIVEIKGDIYLKFKFEEKCSLKYINMILSNLDKEIGIKYSDIDFINEYELLVKDLKVEKIKF